MLAVVKAVKTIIFFILRGKEIRFASFFSF